MLSDSLSHQGTGGHPQQGIADDGDVGICNSAGTRRVTCVIIVSVSLLENRLMENPIGSKKVEGQRS